MVRLRAEKIARIADDIPPVRVDGQRHRQACSWWMGSTSGRFTSAVEGSAGEGAAGLVDSPALTQRSPANLGDVLKGFDKVLVPELNLGSCAC